MAQRLFMLLAACPLLGCALDAAGADDWTALVQTSLLQTSAGLASKDRAASCACLNWKESYKSGAVQCGAGLELTDSELSLHQDVEFCHDFPGTKDSSFFKNADHKYCVNAEKVKGPMKKRYPGSWCYVDASCSELGGGKPVNSRVSYKMCQSGSGESLGEFTPKELFALTERIHADAQMMALMSYEWRGPKEGRGSLLDVAYNASTAGLVGASRKSDTFTVVYKGEVWEISAGATCVKGCS